MAKRTLFSHNQEVSVRKLSLIAVLLCLLPCAASLGLPAPGVCETYFIFSGEAPDAGITFSDGVPAFPVPQEIMKDAGDVLILVNRDNMLDSSYPPKDDLHALESAKVPKTKNEEMLVRKTAHDALKALFAAAREDGANLLLHSANRSHYKQAVQYELRMKDLGYDDGYVQMGGASEHQTGLAFDIVNKAWVGKRFNNEFAKTKEGQWMAEHCAKFGFILRYPNGKMDITGIRYESWHLRYVGKEVALYIMENGLTLEEFHEAYRDYMAK